MRKVNYLNNKDMLKEIHRQLSEIDPDVSIRGTYWDEAYDPVGAFKIYDTGQYVTVEDTPDVSEDEFNVVINNTGYIRLEQKFKTSGESLKLYLDLEII